MRKNVDQKDSFIIPFWGKIKINLILQYYAFYVLEGMVAEMWEMQPCMNDAAAHLVCKNKRTFYGLLMFPYSNPSMNTTSNSSRNKKISGYKIKIANCGEAVLFLLEFNLKHFLSINTIYKQNTFSS